MAGLTAGLPTNEVGAKRKSPFGWIGCKPFNRTRGDGRWRSRECLRNVGLEAGIPLGQCLKNGNGLWRRPATEGAHDCLTKAMIGRRNGARRKLVYDPFVLRALCKTHSGRG